MTSPPMLLRGLSDIADQYDAILCDLWGVIHEGKRAFPEACRALAEFRQTRGPVILVTNAPVPRLRVERLFPNLGVTRDCYDDLLSSGEATRRELALRAPGPVYRIGIEDDRSLYDGLDLAFTERPDEASVVCCTGLRDYTEHHPDQYLCELERLQAANLPMICANPDRQFSYGGRLIWAAGALAERYEALGGQVLRAGKPDPMIYRWASELVQRHTSGYPDSPRVLAIGDGPITDILGANRAGLDALFVGDGIHAAELASGRDFITAADEVLSAHSVFAKHATPRLLW